MDNLTSSSSGAPLLWVAEPSFRGTFGIFSLCLSTLVISVWSAVHFDIPTMRQDVISSFTTSVLWMLAALFCPELLLLIAFNQRVTASGIVKAAEKLLPVGKHAEKEQGFLGSLYTFRSRSSTNLDEKYLEDSVGSTKILRRYQFTMVHGFYASMGGFVFDLTDDDQPTKPAFLPESRTRMTITPTGVHFLMKHHPSLIPDLSVTSITDRTRASSLSKAILLAQVTWFCANCIARLAQGLPLTLLEVTTVAHALCTLATYLLWWSKPLNVAEPTLIRGREAREACALMAMCSPDEKYMLFGTVSIQVPAEMASITVVEKPGDKQGNGRLTIPAPQTPVVSRPRARSESKENLLQPVLFVTLDPEREVAPGLNFTPKKEACRTPHRSWKIPTLYKASSVPWHSKHRKPQEPVSLHSIDINRWQLASSALKRYGLDVKKLELPQKPYLSPNSTLQSSADFKGRGIKAILRSNISAAMLTFIYGFPHFLGWQAHFPTQLEQDLWRIATVMVTIWGAFIAAIVLLAVVVRILIHKYTGERRGEVVLILFAAGPYLAGSGYLLVESLRQLLYLEPAAYVLPAWSNYWPHFS